MQAAEKVKLSATLEIYQQSDIWLMFIAHCA